MLLKILLFYYNKNKGVESKRKREGGRRDNSDNSEYSRLLEIFLYIGL